MIQINQEILRIVMLLTDANLGPSLENSSPHALRKEITALKLRISIFNVDSTKYTISQPINSIYFSTCSCNMITLAEVIHVHVQFKNRTCSWCGSCEICVREQCN